MAHEIEHIDGVAQMAYVSEKPWHGLGVQVAGNLTPHEMMAAAGLDWTIEKVQAKVNDQPIDRYGLVRSSDGKVLDIVSEDWNVLQNEEAFDFFSDFIRAADMSMETAGSLRGGTIVWGLARVKESFEVTPGDRVDSYMLFTSYHKYGFSTDVRFSPIRVVCANTLQLSLNQAASRAVKVSHRKKFDADEVKLVLGVAAEKLEKYKGMAKYLSEAYYTDAKAIEYAMRVFPLPEESKRDISRNAERLLAILPTQPGHEFSEGSYWSLANAATYMVDHELGRTDDTRLQSAWYGHGKNLKLQSMELAMEMAA